MSGLNFSDFLESQCVCMWVCEKGLATEQDSKAFCWCMLFLEGMTETAGILILAV